MIYHAAGVVIRDAEAADIAPIAFKLRPEDAAECLSVHAMTPDKAVAFSFALSSPCMTVEHADGPIAMFGLVRDPDGAKGFVWFLGARGMRRIRKQFLRLSPVFLEHFLKSCPVLHNHVDARYAGAVRWLKWLGADIKPAQPFGAAGLPFHYFEFRRSDHVRG